MDHGYEGWHGCLLRGRSVSQISTGIRVIPKIRDQNPLFMIDTYICCSIYDHNPSIS